MRICGGEGNILQTVVPGMVSPSLGPSIDARGSTREKAKAGHGPAGVHEGEHYAFDRHDTGRESVPRGCVDAEGTRRYCVVGLTSAHEGWTPSLIESSSTDGSAGKGHDGGRKAMPSGDGLRER